MCVHWVILGPFKALSFTNIAQHTQGVRGAPPSRHHAQHCNLLGAHWHALPRCACQARPGRHLQAARWFALPGAHVQSAWQAHAVGHPGPRAGQSWQAWHAHPLSAV